MVAPVILAVVAGLSLFTGGAIVHHKAPVLGSVMEGTGLGVAAGGGLGTVAGIGFGVTEGAVYGGSLGLLGGSLVAPGGRECPVHTRKNGTQYVRKNCT